MLKLFAGIAALFLGVGSSAFAQIEGGVYIDTNRNGIRDAGEKGIKGVCVQDGLHVVQTAEDGSFILPGHKDTRFITLTVPDGFQASASHYLPFDGTGKKYELGICKSPVRTGNGYSFVQITDTETSLYGDWIDNLKEYVKQIRLLLSSIRVIFVMKPIRIFTDVIFVLRILGFRLIIVWVIMICVPEGMVKSYGRVISVLHGIRSMLVMCIMWLLRCWVVIMHPRIGVLISSVG